MAAQLDYAVDERKLSVQTEYISAPASNVTRNQLECDPWAGTLIETGTNRGGEHDVGTTLFSEMQDIKLELK